MQKYVFENIDEIIWLIDGYIFFQTFFFHLFIYFFSVSFNKDQVHFFKYNLLYISLSLHIDKYKYIHTHTYPQKRFLCFVFFKSSKEYNHNLIILSDLVYFSIITLVFILISKKTYITTTTTTIIIIFTL